MNKPMKACNLQGFMRVGHILRLTKILGNDLEINSMGHIPRFHTLKMGEILDKKLEHDQRTINMFSKMVQYNQ
jgi:hypothetical protein